MYIFVLMLHFHSYSSYNEQFKLRSLPRSKASNMECYLNSAKEQCTAIMYAAVASCHIWSATGQVCSNNEFHLPCRPTYTGTCKQHLYKSLQAVTGRTKSTTFHNTWLVFRKLVAARLFYRFHFEPSMKNIKRINMNCG
jgi:hypothetical protein